MFNEANSPIRGSFPGFRPANIFQDHSGRYWIAPSRAGDRLVVAYEETSERWTIFGEQQDGRLPALHYYSGALIPFNVSRIGESRDGQIWFADRPASPTHTSRRPLLSSFDGKQWHRYEVDKVLSGDVNIGFFRDAAGTLWFWTGEELRSYDRGKWSAVSRVSDLFKEPPLTGEHAAARQRVRYEILDAIQDREGYWWLGMVSGIVRYDKRRGEWKRFPRIEQNQHIYEDKAGRLWFADWDYVSVYDKTKDSTKTFRLSDHILEDRCGDSFPGLNCLYQDNAGRCCLGTAADCFAFQKLRANGNS